MEKLKLASSSLGERLKTGSAQMSRIVSSKMKEILQSPTPESKMVDEATSEHMEEPNWGMNLRICAMINSEEFSGTEVVKAVKKKLAAGKSPIVQRLSLDLLEACTSNCEKVFSEVASEKVLDEMVRVIDDPKTPHEIKVKATQLIRAWGESDDLKYLPVFHQTYMNLKTREVTPSAGEGRDFPPGQYSLESFMNQPPMSPRDNYPLSGPGDVHGVDNAMLSYNYGSQSLEEKKEILEITRNSLDILSSILNSGTGLKPVKDDLTVSMLEKCKQSLPAVQMIVESTTDDEVMLFEALNLHDQLQQIICKFDEMDAVSAPLSDSGPAPAESSETTANLPAGQEEGNVSNNKSEKPGSLPKEGASSPSARGM